MNLSKALKEKNKLASEYQKVLSRFQQGNSSIEGSTKRYSSKVLLDDVINMRNALIRLKTAIHKASEPVRVHIFALSELKTYLSILERMDTKEGVEINTNYSGPNTETKYVADFNQNTMDTMIKNIKEEIDNIQDEIDLFNATTQVEI
jgi:hypothetical protein